MNFPDEVSEFLTKLNEFFDDDTDLRATFLGLTDNLTAAVPFFLGLTLTLYTGAGHDGQVTLNILSPTAAAAVRTSLVLHLDGLGTSSAGSTLVLYAGRRGALAGLAADARSAFGNGLHVVVDEDLPAGYYPAAVAEGIQQPAINQAIGVLLDNGHTPLEAPIAIRGRASEEGVTLRQAAEHIIESTPNVEPGPAPSGGQPKID